MNKAGLPVRGLLLVFIVLPILEMWVLIKVGSNIGAFSTIALVFLTAIVGVALLRLQGIATLSRANKKLRTGELPAQEMAEGLFLAVGGALLLTPGFITDAIGFMCLVPGLRQWVLGRLITHIVTLRSSGAGGFAQSGGPHSQTDTKSSAGRVIEGEYKRDD